MSSVKSLTSTFETAQSPTAVNKRAHNSVPTGSVGGGESSVDTESILGKNRQSVRLDNFLKNEVIPRGGMPGAVHKSAVNKPPPNELDNKAKELPKFDGKPHPVYQLMFQGKQHESSTTKKKIVIPPSSAY
ncbi:hypothetical protein SAMD00019534_055030 [Acytostelium subglobosum LB1]|uniref:hypothetical protein n=1 Tax=Acytostelium subglobosum LB1 TaxID=1410327 RepID=UPI000644F4ED|nr:hypothetical protein SAMD00019534_055030 [Acytostelium subglobosum LB1]GAM22328.1 hypothetical protein SAMD00019534_055030 [Acytostelium subglobosum LB1]|eukprot:XP_012754448.1 hypothetical protein SAMD00019534_055030 [Acytostelium subglobosum LB1]